MVWAPVNNTLRQVFPKVQAYNQAVYSFLDEWGCVHSILQRIPRRCAHRSSNLTAESG